MMIYKTLEDKIKHTLGMSAKVFISRISTTSRFYYIRVPKSVGIDMHGKEVIVVVIPVKSYEIGLKAE